MSNTENTSQLGSSPLARTNLKSRLTGRRSEGFAAFGKLVGHLDGRAFVQRQAEEQHGANGEQQAGENADAKTEAMYCLRYIGHFGIIFEKPFHNHQKRSGAKRQTRL